MVIWKAADTFESVKSSIRDTFRIAKLMEEMQSRRPAAGDDSTNSGSGTTVGWRILRTFVILIALATSLMVFPSMIGFMVLCWFALITVSVVNRDYLWANQKNGSWSLFLG